MGARGAEDYETIGLVLYDKGSGEGGGALRALSVAGGIPNLGGYGISSISQRFVVWRPHSLCFVDRIRAKHQRAAGGGGEPFNFYVWGSNFFDGFLIGTHYFMLISLRC